MDRANIFADHDDKRITGWFDWDAIKGRWSDRDHNNNGSHGTGRGEEVILTAGGKWVMNHWTAWQGESSTRVYMTADEAREWLLRNGEDAAVEEHLGEIPAEEDRRPGRPAIGNEVQVRLGDMLEEIDAWAEARGIKRAEAIRRLVSAALSATFTQGEPVGFEGPGGELVRGWYVSQFGYNVSTVTLEPPADWFIKPGGKPMPPAFTRRDCQLMKLAD